MNWIFENVSVVLSMMVPLCAIGMMYFMYRVFTNQVDL